MSGSVTFYGRGYGHGVGMSQYGARGRALAGQTAPEILAHYYQGTTLGTVNPNVQMRVLLMTGFAATSTTPLVLFGRSAPFTIDGVDGTWPADTKVTIVPTTVGSARTWRLVLRNPAGAALLSTIRCCDLRLRPASTTGTIQVYSKPSGYDTYRGLIRVYGTTKLTVVNEVPLDTYLRGVVPVEMPASWPAEAVRSQIIAARSYAVAHRHPTTGSWDVYDDTRSQVYRGIKAELNASNAAIDAAAGIVLRSGTVVANTLFHSAGGGATESNRTAFPTSTGVLSATQLAYLRGAVDRTPAGTPYDAGSPYVSWRTATYTVTQLSAIFGADTRTSVGTIRRIELVGRGVSGRLYRITLVGSTGTKTVSGDVFRAVFNAHRPSADPMLRSTLFDLRPVG